MRALKFIFFTFLSFNLNAQSLLISNNSGKIVSTIKDFGFFHEVPGQAIISTYMDGVYCNFTAFYTPLKFAVNSGPPSVIYDDNLSNITHVNYTALGSNAPLIKTKLLTGVTPAFDGSSTSSSPFHGISDYTKILSVNIEVSVPASGFTPARTYPEEYTFAPGYQVSYFINGGAVIVINSNSNSFNVRNMPFKVYITYEQ
jgi:hypothetical protein